MSTNTTNYKAAVQLNKKSNKIDISIDGIHKGIFAIEDTIETIDEDETELSATALIGLIDTTAGAFTDLTLPEATEGQIKYLIMTVDNGNATITEGGENINGYATLVFTGVNSSATLMYDGTNWNVLALKNITTT